MASGARPTIIGFLVVMFFAFAIIGFVFSWLYATNPDSPALVYNNMSGYYSDINSSINNMKDYADSASAKLEGAESSPVEYLFLISQAFFEIGKMFLSPITSGFKVITGILFSTLFGNPIIAAGVAVLFAGLVISVVFYFIKFLRTGESER